MKKKLTLKEKDRIVRNIYKGYQRAQLDILYFKQHYNYYPQVDLFKVSEPIGTYLSSDTVFLNQLAKKQELEFYVSIVNQIHLHLSPDVYSFVENEYLNFYSASWWTPYFSRSSYYRMKHKALNEIFTCARNFWNDEELMKFNES